MVWYYSLVPTENRRLQPDVIRVIATILVIIVHVCGQFLDTSFAHLSVNWWVANMVETGAKIAVPLFIMLSGSLLLNPYKKESFRVFYQKRLARIGIPILFWPLFYYFATLLAKGLPFTLPAFTTDFIFLNIFYHLYFLFIMLGLYIITPFLRTALANFSTIQKKGFIAMLFGFSVISALLIHIYPARINFWSIITVFIPFVGYFVAGQFLPSILLSETQKRHWWFIFWGILVCVATVKLYTMSIGAERVYRYFADALSINIVALSLISYVLLFNQKLLFFFFEKPHLKSALKEVSDSSFGIYLIHPILIFLINIQFPATDGRVFVLFTKVVVVFLLSLMAASTGRRIPGVKALLGN